MTDRDRPPSPRRRRSRQLLAAFFLFFGLFTANILIGKAQVAWQWQAPFLLNDVAEFLLLLTAALLFVLAALVREAEQGDRAGQQEKR